MVPAARRNHPGQPGIANSIVQQRIRQLGIGTNLEFGVDLEMQPGVTVLGGTVPLSILLSTARCNAAPTLPGSNQVGTAVLQGQSVTE